MGVVVVTMVYSDGVLITCWVLEMQRRVKATYEVLVRSKRQGDVPQIALWFYLSPWQVAVALWPLLCHPLMFGASAPLG